MTDDRRPTTDDRRIGSTPSSSVGRRSSDKHPSSIVASAPAKLILCGEHAVVYGRPAIALPLSGIRAHAAITAGDPGSGMILHARNLERSWRIADKPSDPLSLVVVDALQLFGISAPPDLLLSITSDIPIASGMGSGASVATALVRALAQFSGHDMTNEQISALVYESEKRLHGTPSGIDNTVVAYERPIWFQRTTDDGRRTTDEEVLLSSAVYRPSSVIEPITIAAPFTLLIGDTGVRSATRLPVGDVRRRWQNDPARYNALFDHVGAIVAQVRAELARAGMGALGPLLNENHTLLQQIGVSSPDLDRLVAAAREAGALGAKLSGAGWGGVMLALVDSRRQPAVVDALHAAGATRVLATEVRATGEQRD
ncbi:MAG TPA: mevalonate kinase [Roseiflexaceae bacterium]|nr:mevalonate kinase [Roseiflexaceae bacterium]